MAVLSLPRAECLQAHQPFNEVSIQPPKIGIDFVSQRVLPVQLAQGLGGPSAWSAAVPAPVKRCQAARPVVLSSKSLLSRVLPDAAISQQQLWVLFIHACVLRACAIAKRFMAS